MKITVEHKDVPENEIVLRCRELKWPYLNGILRRWHQQGISGPEEAARAEKRETPAKENSRTTGQVPVRIHGRYYLPYGKLYC